MSNLQGGDNEISKKFYSSVFRYIKNGDRVLNFGCGQKFVFESALLGDREVDIVSVDILPAPKKMPAIKQYLRRSVEEKIIVPGQVDVVTFFELLEHIDQTDKLLENAYSNLKKGGLLLFSIPNLSSLYSRIELAFGYQPHILEVSNKFSNFGTGVFGRINSPGGESIHHIRGITSRAAKEMVEYYNFKVEKIIGYDYHSRFKLLNRFFPGLAPVNIFVCKKY